MSYLKLNELRAKFKLADTTTRPQIRVVVGPSGSGKTTAVNVLLELGLPAIDADALGGKALTDSGLVEWHYPSTQVIKAFLDDRSLKQLIICGHGQGMEKVFKDLNTDITIDFAVLAIRPDSGKMFRRSMNRGLIQWKDEKRVDWSILKYKEALNGYVSDEETVAILESTKDEISQTRLDDLIIRKYYIEFFKELGGSKISFLGFIRFKDISTLVPKRQQTALVSKNLRGRGNKYFSVIEKESRTVKLGQGLQIRSDLPTHFVPIDFGEKDSAMKNIEKMSVVLNRIEKEGGDAQIVVNVDSYGGYLSEMETTRSFFVNVMRISKQKPAKVEIIFRCLSIPASASVGFLCYHAIRIRIGRETMSFLKKRGVMHHSSSDPQSIPYSDLVSTDQTMYVVLPDKLTHYAFGTMANTYAEKTKVRLGALERPTDVEWLSARDGMIFHEFSLQPSEPLELQNPLTMERRRFNHETLNGTSRVTILKFNPAVEEKAAWKFKITLEPSFQSAITREDYRTYLRLPEDDDSLSFEDMTFPSQPLNGVARLFRSQYGFIIQSDDWIISLQTKDTIDSIWFLPTDSIYARKYLSQRRELLTEDNSPMTSFFERLSDRFWETDRWMELLEDLKWMLDVHEGNKILREMKDE